MSINRYPESSGVNIVYGGSGLNPEPSATVGATIYSISSNVDFIVDNIRYNADTDYTQYYTSSKTIYQLPFLDARFYSFTTRATHASNNLRACIYANGLYAYGGDGQRFNSSTDGITWASRAIFSTGSVSSIYYGNGLWVACGDNNRLSTSTDAVTWTSRVSNGASTSIWRVVGYGGGTYIVAGSTILSTSTDGITWTTRTFPYTGWTEMGNTYAYGASTHVMGIVSGGLISSTDGITWTTRLQAPSTNNDFQTVDFLNNVFYAATAQGVGFPSLIYSSTNGTTWTLRYTAPSSTYGDILPRIVYNGSSYIALLQSDGAFVISTDGINWVTSKNSGTTIQSVSGADQDNLLNNGSNNYTFTTSNGNVIATFDKKNVDTNSLFTDIGTLFRVVSAV